MSPEDKAAREAHARGKVLLYIPPQGGHPSTFAHFDESKEAGNVPKEKNLTRMSDDPKDPLWRFRVTEEESGLYVIAEEELSSKSAKAKVTGTTNKLIMTPAQAMWMADALADLVRHHRASRAPEEVIEAVEVTERVSA